MVGRRPVAVAVIVTAFLTDEQQVNVTTMVAMEWFSV